MKFGTVFLVYILGVILAAAGRLGNLLVGLLIILGCFAVIGLIGWLFRWDKTISFSIRWGTKVLVIFGFGLVAMLTWKGFLSIIFH